MKRLFYFVALVVICFTFQSCEKGEQYCWKIEIEYEYKYDNNEKSDIERETDYVFNTKEGIDLLIQEYKKQLILEGCYNISIKKEKVKYSESDCWGKNDY